MSKRFSILVRESGSGREIELCQVDSNPERIAEAAGMKRLRKSSMGRRYYTQKYHWIRIIDNGEASTVPHINVEKSPDNAGTNAVKFLLKRLARQYDFQSLNAREEVASAAALHPSNRTALQQLRDDVASRVRVVSFDPNTSALVIETAITDNAPPFNQPWPPTGLGDGWRRIDEFSTRQRTFWRRIRLEYARPSPRARPIHR
jgi:hypothetical protein